LWSRNKKLFLLACLFAAFEICHRSHSPLCSLFQIPKPTKIQVKIAQLILSPLLKTEIKRLRVEDEESVYLFLMQFMECQKETAGSLRQRYEQQYRCEHPVHRLELTPELFLVLDGQTLADFGGDNWRQKLEEMELVL
jgi:hypothetical protein